MISPTGHFAHWSFRLQDSSPIGQFAYRLSILPTNCRNKIRCVDYWYERLYRPSLTAKIFFKISFNQKNTQTNHVRTQQHKNGRPTNMEVTSLLLGWQKYEIPADLISKMFYLHSVSIRIIRYILKQVHAAIIRTTSKAQLAAHLWLYATRNKPLQSCRTFVVINCRVQGIPHCGFFGASVSSPTISFLIWLLMNRCLTKIWEN